MINFLQFETDMVSRFLCDNNIPAKVRGIFDFIQMHNIKFIHMHDQCQAIILSFLCRITGISQWHFGKE